MLADVEAACTRQRVGWLSGVGKDDPSVHFAIRGVLSAAERWERDSQQAIALPAPQAAPAHNAANPPTAAEAAQIIDASGQDVGP